MVVCANCPVWLGECPQCRTFWVRGGPAGQRYGIRPAASQQFAGPTDQLSCLAQLGNVVESWKEPA